MQDTFNTTFFLSLILTVMFLTSAVKTSYFILAVCLVLVLLTFSTEAVPSSGSIKPKHNHSNPDGKEQQHNHGHHNDKHDHKNSTAIDNSGNNNATQQFATTENPIAVDKKDQKQKDDKKDHKDKDDKKDHKDKHDKKDETKSNATLTTTVATAPNATTTVINAPKATHPIISKHTVTPSSTKKQEPAKSTTTKAPNPATKNAPVPSSTKKQEPATSKAAPASSNKPAATKNAPVPSSTKKQEPAKSTTTKAPNPATKNAPVPSSTKKQEPAKSTTSKTAPKTTTKKVEPKPTSNAPPPINLAGDESGKPCTHGAIRCATATSLKTCVSGVWEETFCPEETVCSQLFGVPAICVKLGMIPHASTENRTCLADQVGTTTCANANLVGTCQASENGGYEWSISRCPEKSHCFVNSKFEGGCVAAPDNLGTCNTPYQQFCTNDFFYQTCELDKWIAQPCPLGTVCKTNADNQVECTWA